jgi:hypothetical protein
MRTKQPALRITKWLRGSRIVGADIPLEAECTACADIKFEAPFDLRQHLEKPFHQPDRDRFHKELPSAFDRHVNLVHADQDEEV